MSPRPTDAETRRDLAACHRLVHLQGWTDLIHTHLSARLPSAPDRVLITPYGRGFDEVCASQLVTVDSSGTVVDDPAGFGVHPAALPVHLPLYQARNDVHAVLHTHTVAGIAVASQAEGLRPLSQHALRFHGRLARHAYAGIALDPDEGAHLARDLGPHNAMLLDNHGLLVAGSTVPAAFERLYFLEKACQIQIAIGSAPALKVEPAIAEHTAAQFARPERTAVAVTWALLRRQLDATSPGYTR